MNERVRKLLEQITSLEEELRTALNEQQGQILYRIKDKTIQFDHDLRQAHRRVRIGLLRWLRRSEPRNVVSAPFIYGMIVPLAAARRTSARSLSS